MVYPRIDLVGGEKLDGGGHRLTWLPTTCARGECGAGPNYNCNVVFTCTRKGWGFCLVTLTKLLSPKLIVPPPAPGRAAQKPMCSGVPELYLLGARVVPSHRLRGQLHLHHIVVASSPMHAPFSPPLATAKLLVGYQPSPHPSLGAVVELLPTAATQQPPPLSLLVTGHHTPLPRFSVWHPLRVHARTLMESVVLATMLRRRNVLHLPTLGDPLPISTCG
uniref:Uncharacterized protein n=1 Tax=Oryza barthii TaxID=65489 RepID=A0A0D3GMP5_9ORYZ